MQQPAIQTSFGSFGAPPDRVAVAALVLGFVLLWLGYKWSRRTAAAGPTVGHADFAADAASSPGPSALSPRERWCLAAMAFSAALLSWGYVAYYLKGGPRIIDATSYWLESRAIASGQWGIAVPSPTASFSGRFLLPSADGAHLAPIFPPGYPTALALFQKLGAPLLLGPALACLLVLTSFGCARLLFPRSRLAPWFAAMFATISASLRYHTADTMSHGFCAALLSGAVWLALSAQTHNADAATPQRWRWGDTGRWLAAGVCLGMLVATRPITGAVLGLLLLGVLLRPNVGSTAVVSQTESNIRAVNRIGLRSISRPALALLLGSLPGALLLLWHQHATTGAFGGATQLAYYALADGPPGCFGYGFGARGCMYEHGDFVNAQLPHGYGFWEACGTSARRLKAHLLDAGNLELFCLALPVIVWRWRKLWAVRWIAAALLLQLIGYAPFYFDGNYPGGGARFLVDVLPLEFALLGFGVAMWSRRWLVPGLSLLGFALHGSFEHVNLSERDGGDPMFEDRAFDDSLVVVGTGERTSFAQHAEAIRRATHGPVTPGAVVFVDTDHGFSLGHSPAVFQRFEAQAGAEAGAAPPILSNLLVARRTYDAREALLLQALGRPPSFNYLRDPQGKALGTWVDFPPPPLGESIRLEAEYDWPPISVSGGWVHPDWPPGTCVSLRRGLRLRASPSGGPVRIELELVGPRPGRYSVLTHWARMQVEDAHNVAAPGQVELGSRGGRSQASRRHVLDLAPGRCAELPGPDIELDPTSAPGRLPTAWLQVAVTQEDFVLDWVELKAL